SENIIAAEIRLRLVESNKARHFERQTLLVVGGAALCFLYGHHAMSCRGAQAYRGQWTRRAIVLNINIDADPDVLASLALGSAINGLVLSRGQGTEPGNEYRKCRSHTFHITPPQS